MLIFSLLAVSSVTVAGEATDAQSENAIRAELIAAVLQVDRKETVARGLMLTAREGEKFWPVYHEYRVVTNQTEHKLIDLMTRYVNLHSSPHFSDKQASQLLDTFLSLQQQLLKVKRRYTKRFRQAIPARKVARFYQLDHRMDLLEMLKLANSIPLVEE